MNYYGTACREPLPRIDLFLNQLAELYDTVIHFAVNRKNLLSEMFRIFSSVLLSIPLPNWNKICVSLMHFFYVNIITVTVVKFHPQLFFLLVAKAKLTVATLVKKNFTKKNN